jgi:ferredoxin
MQRVNKPQFSLQTQLQKPSSSRCCRAHCQACRYAPEVCQTNTMTQRQTHRALQARMLAVTGATFVAMSWSQLGFYILPPTLRRVEPTMCGPVLDLYWTYTRDCHTGTLLLETCQCIVVRRAVAPTHQSPTAPYLRAVYKLHRPAPILHQSCTLNACAYFGRCSTSCHQGLPARWLWRAAGPQGESPPPLQSGPGEGSLFQPAHDAIDTLKAKPLRG